MIDHYNREINYMRISVTDRCNLRCRYCMPDDIDSISHEEILRYEEILRVCQAAAANGIINFKITGGEPLVRRGLTDFLAKLKSLDGVKTVTLTTNGILLTKKIDKLAAAGVDGINISLDTIDPKQYQEITGFDACEQVLQGIKASVTAGIRTKLNCVLLKETKSQLLLLAEMARRYPVDVRFIELMPIGAGKESCGISQKEAREILLKYYPDLSSEKKEKGLLDGSWIGNGPACYETSSFLQGRIGWISAISHIFCASCNRVRLTSTGFLKPCLCYGEGTDLRTLLRNGSSDRILNDAIYEAVRKKPKEHCFSDETGPRVISETHRMIEIGG